MLQKDRSVPRDMQNTNFADCFSSVPQHRQLHCLTVSAIYYIARAAWPTGEPPDDGVSCGSVISIFPKAQFTVIGSMSIQCTHKTAGFQPWTGVVRME